MILKEKILIPIGSIKAMAEYIKENYQNTRLVISAATMRKDGKNMMSKIKQLNVNLSQFCESHNIDFITNDNVTDRKLAPDKLHLNPGGTAVLAGNYIKYLKTF